MVHPKGLEPLRFQHKHLKFACLPIPSRVRIKLENVYQFTLGCENLKAKGNYKYE